MTDLLGSIFGGSWTWIAALAGGLVVLAGTYLKGRAAGKAKVRTDQLEQTLENREKRDEIDADVGSLSDAELRERLRRDAQP